MDPRRPKVHDHTRYDSGGPADPNHRGVDRSGVVTGERSSETWVTGRVSRGRPGETGEDGCRPRISFVLGGTCLCVCNVYSLIYH